MDNERLNTIAMNLYAGLYARYDGISSEEARQYYEEVLQPKRKDLLKNAILWLRDQKGPSLEKLLPEFYARTWAEEGDPDWEDSFEGADELDHSEWIPLMEQIIKIKD